MCDRDTITNQRQIERSRCKDDYVVNFFVRWSSSCSSSWERLCSEFTFNQNSAQANIVTVIQNNWEVDQGLERNLRCPCWQQLMWQRTTLLTARTVVFSDSVMCMGGISSNPVKGWKEKTDLSLNSRQYRELDRIDGEPMEFEWKISQDSPHCRSALRFRTWWLTWSVILSNSKDELSSCRCTRHFMDKKETEKLVLRILLWLQIMLGN